MDNSCSINQKKKDEHHRLCITTHSDHQRIPIPDEVFARDENQKSRNVLYKTKQKLFSFLIIFVYTHLRKYIFSQFFLYLFLGPPINPSNIPIIPPCLGFATPKNLCPILPIQDCKVSSRFKLLEYLFCNN